MSPTFPVRKAGELHGERGSCLCTSFPVSEAADLQEEVPVSASSKGELVSLAAVLVRKYSQHRLALVSVSPSTTTSLRESNRTSPGSVELSSSAEGCTVASFRGQ